jgi:cold shock CspA family protein
VNFKSIEDIFQRMSELQGSQDIFVRLSDEEMKNVQQMSQGAQRVQAQVAQEKIRGENKLKEVAAEGANKTQEQILDKALERIGPDQLLNAEARIERNGDVQMLNEGPPQVGG